MRSFRPAGIMIAAALAATPAFAQQTPPASSSPPASASDSSSAQASTTPPPAPAPATVQASQTPAAPLTVATVKLDSGWRASKLIGNTVFNEQGQKVGTVDDLVLTNSNKVVVAIISVGGFLGIGSKLVAVPYSDLRVDQNMKVVMPGATKDALNTMPSFTYSNT